MKNLNNNEIKYILNNCKYKTYKKNKIIGKEKEKIKDIKIIKNGNINVKKFIIQKNHNSYSGFKQLSIKENIIFGEFNKKYNNNKIFFNKIITINKEKMIGILEIFNNKINYNYTYEIESNQAEIIKINIKFFKKLMKYNDRFKMDVELNYKNINLLLNFNKTIHYSNFFGKKNNKIGYCLIDKIKNDIKKNIKIDKKSSNNIIFYSKNKNKNINKSNINILNKKKNNLKNIKFRSNTKIKNNKVKKNNIIIFKNNNTNWKILSNKLPKKLKLF